MVRILACEYSKVAIRGRNTIINILSKWPVDLPYRQLWFADVVPSVKFNVKTFTLISKIKISLTQSWFFSADINRLKNGRYILALSKQWKYYVFQHWLKTYCTLYNTVVLSQNVLTPFETCTCTFCICWVRRFVWNVSARYIIWS